MGICAMQYFLAVIREGTIPAAESLHVPQPFLSRQVKALEEELGVTLFERGNRRITLTEEGHVLRRHAEELVRLMQLTLEEIAQASPLCFRPLAGQRKTAGALIWKKYQALTPAVQLFIDLIRNPDSHSRHSSSPHA